MPFVMNRATPSLRRGSLAFYYKNDVYFCGPDILF